ncbi:hypothetical protein EJ06DRAFT_520557 [Trichodelitschia bisporula]|uniref:DUF7702 domain-containing protein n=1 Tax=Trichodelitschia bisporula TaxID=703511 RepID=A0A6G1I3B4_9PEZI|nr:hypothetical protein EJ06DRAFT_520557 [Trichodelitschia bisporula]
MPSPHQSLAIALLVLWTPLLLPAFLVLRKHGVGRHLGWFYLLSLPLVRIVGAGIELGALASHPPDLGLYTASSILYAIGLVPLLLAAQGVSSRVNDKLPAPRLPMKVFMAAKLATIVGLALAIAAGTMLSPSADAGSQNTGRTLRRVAAIIFDVLCAGQVGAAVWFEYASLQLQYTKFKTVNTDSNRNPRLMITRQYFLTQALARMLVPHQSLAIALLVVWTALFPLSFFLASKHGSPRINIVPQMYIMGAATELIAFASAPQNIGFCILASTCYAVGLFGLLAMAQGVSRRVNNVLPAPYIPLGGLTAAEVVTAVGGMFSIAGCLVLAPDPPLLDAPSLHASHILCSIAAVISHVLCTGQVGVAMWFVTRR